MRKVCLPLLLGLLMLVATRVSAAISTSTITGQVFKADGTADANDVIWFTPNPPTQTVAGGQVTAQAVATTTDSNGNLAAISLAQGITINITLLNGATGPVTGCVPVTATSTFISVISCTNASTFTGITLNSLAPPTANYSLAGFGLTNVGSLVGGSGLMSITGGSGGVAIKGTTTTGLDSLSSINVNGIDNVVDWGADSTGTSDSWAALMSTVADACTNNRAVLFPPGTYKVLTPFAPVCATHPLAIYSDAGTVAEVSGSPAVTIKEAFSGDLGPTVILDHNQEISSLNGGAILTSPAVGSVGKSLSFTSGGTQIVYAVDLNDVLPHPAQKLNGLPAFDYRGWYNLASLTTGGGSFGNFLVGSVGGVDAASNNTYEACNINTGSGYEGDGLSNSCEGVFALQTGTDGKIFARFYTTGAIYRINSGSTTWGTGAWHFVELSYDGTNLRLIIDGTLRGTIAASGTTIQRADESVLIGQELPQFLHTASGSVPLLNGQIYSPEISTVARSTCGGSTTLGASCYTNPTTANPGDSNSLFLWNGDLTNLPVNGGIAVPVLEPDRANGVAMNTTTTTAWLHVRAIGGGNPIGCCSQVIMMRGFNIQGGTHGIDDNGEQVILNTILTFSSNFAGAGDVGIELSANATFNSAMQHIFAANGGSPAAYLPLAILGGLSEGDDLNMGCAGLCLEDGGGNYSDIFTQLSNSNKWTLVHLGSATTFIYANFDNENGAVNVPVVYVAGTPLTLINSSLTPGGGATYRLEANGGNYQINQLGGKLAPSGTTIIDASALNGAEPQEYNFSGVNYGGFVGNIPNGLQWINPASFMKYVHIDPVSEQAFGNKNAQQYSLLQGLHIAGPIVGGLNETGAITTTALATPAAPTVTPKGTTGATSYTYFCVAHDATSTSVPTGATLPSAGTTITNGNATLNATNFNQIQCGPQQGVFSWDVLKTNTATSLALAQSGYQVIVNDTGQATAGYTAPTRNSTGDVTLASGANFTLGTDNTVASVSRMPLAFPIAAVAATTTTQWGEQKITKAITIENVVFDVGAFTCSVNPAISLFDCSATAGTCTPVSTLATSGTLTAIGSTNAATTPTANVAAGEYIAAEFTAGTCTVLNGSVQAMARPQ